MLVAARDRTCSTDLGIADVSDDAPVLAGAHIASTPKPFDLEFVTISRREHIELKLQARQYQSLHTRALERMQWMQRRHDHELAQAGKQIAQLQAELVLVRAQNRDLRQRVFGSKTEQSRSVNMLPSGAVPADDALCRPRGQQRGRRGHGRTRLPELPAVVQELGGTITCPRCGAAATPAWGSDDAQVLEIEVRAYRRIVRRRRYRPACRCGCLPAVMTAAAPAALWPRNKLGISVWVELLLSKFLYAQPTSRLLQDWAERGLPIAQGTITEGLRRLAPLFEPIMAACLSQVRSASHWHADETRWEVFEELPGKSGHRWYLWVFKADRAVCFVLDPSRSSAVPARTLEGADGGILSVDRHAAYRKFARQVPGMSLALCWAHQRRDFLRVANDYPALWGWAVQWVQRVGELYALHAARRRLMHCTSSAALIEADAALRGHVALLQQQCDAQLADPQLAAPARKVLRGLKSYWAGLVGRRQSGWPVKRQSSWPVGRG
ncbi:MAG: IS66 family transposase [Nitrospira sp.]|nr:IS66 family transposase [Nitrospira sp.]